MTHLQVRRRNGNRRWGKPVAAHHGMKQQLTAPANHGLVKFIRSNRSQPRKEGAHEILLDCRGSRPRGDVSCTARFVECVAMRGAHGSSRSCSRLRRSCDGGGFRSNCVHGSVVGNSLCRIPLAGETLHRRRNAHAKSWGRHASAGAGPLARHGSKA